MNKIASLKGAIGEIIEKEGSRYFYTASQMNQIMRSLDFTKLYSALMDRNQQLYTFCSIGMEGNAHQYFASKLVPQNASLLWRSEPELFGRGELPCFKVHELWLLEDMTVIATACFQAAQDPECLTSEYREIKGDEWPDYLDPINIADLWQFLHDLYASAEADEEADTDGKVGPVIFYEP